VIPVKIYPDQKPVLASERHITMAPDHPQFTESCPVCDMQLGSWPTVLILVGVIKPGMGACVQVHESCAGVPGATT
jgi:hypothetical protein